MSILKFNNQEIEIIKSSFEFRKIDMVDYSNNHNKELDSIIEELDKPVINLKPKCKSIITGCIREFPIRLNKVLTDKSDFEIFQSWKKHELDYLKIDLGNRILVELKKKTSDKRSYQWIFDRFREIESAKEVFFSKTDEGKIYKTGIVLKENWILQSELEEPQTLEKFDFGKTIPNSFTNLGTPNEVIILLNQYSLKNKLTEGQLKLLTILKTASV